MFGLPCCVPGGVPCKVTLGTRGSAGLWAELGLSEPGWRAGGLWAGLRRVGIKMHRRDGFFFLGGEKNEVNLGARTGADSKLCVGKQETSLSCVT